MGKRERWGTRIGLILAVAGNAVGLGNFLRFPSQATQNGGGAFMIPYLFALLFLGIPLMWLEWAMGRFGGTRGHGSMPGIFYALHPARWARYLGVLGIVVPLGISTYYLYIESWTLAYSAFSITGSYHEAETLNELRTFLADFQGRKEGSWLSFGLVAYVCFLLTWATNFVVLYRGIARGIELLAKIAMPLLFLFASVIAIRVLTLGAPDPSRPENTAISGLAFIWNPDFSRLTDARVWLAAAGQIFFTLSLATGAIQVYASYLREKDDVALSGLTTAATNEFAEVVLGGSIAIPAAFAFFGCSTALAIAKGGAFDLGFISMPAVFHQMTGGTVFGTMWFMLLFFAGITSSVALTQPAIAFFEDELGMERRRAVTITMLILLVAGHVPVLGLAYGALDEMDFWSGTFGLALFALIEVVLFVFLFERKRGLGEGAWEQIHIGAEIRVPAVYKEIIKWVVPTYLFVLLVAWTVQEGPSYLLMKDAASPEAVAWRWAGRGVLITYFVLFLVLIRKAIKTKETLR